MKRAWLLPLSVLVAIPIALQKPHSEKAPESYRGAIQGYVVDADGQPIVGARVFALPHVGGFPRPPETAVTTAKGEFLLTQAQVGANSVFASKNGDGYPDTTFAAFTDGVVSVPQVNVNAGSTAAGVVVELKKGGQLSGTVSDFQTKKPIVGAEIVISRADDPHLYVAFRSDTAGHFTMDVPARPFNVQISQPGYTTWENGELAPHSKGPPICVAPATRREFSMALKRNPKENTNRE